MHWILSHVEAGCPLESSTSNSESDSEHQPLGHQPLRHQSLGHPLPGDKRIPNENCIRGDKLSGGHNHHDTATGLGVAGIEGATTTEGVGVEGVGVEKAAAGGGVAVRVGEVVDAGAVEVMATRWVMVVVCGVHDVVVVHMGVGRGGTWVWECDVHAERTHMKTHIHASAYLQAPHVQTPPTQTHPHLQPKNQP